MHDSYFTNLERIGQNIELAFDWGKLENFIEGNIEEAIILGATKLIIKGIVNEKFRGYYHKEKIWKPINTPKNIVNSWHSIAENHINEITKEIMINGMFTTEKEEFWIEWTFNYNSCEVEWNNYVTFSEWKEGKLPNDC